MSPAKHIPWLTRRADGQGVHLRRSRFYGNVGFPRHTHGFAELFWIEQGTGLHLLADGEVPLQAGDCVAIEPDCCHGFAALDQVGFTLVNVAFPTRCLDLVRRQAGDTWPWTDVRRPVALSLRARSRLTGWIGELNDEDGDLAAEAFLFDVLRVLEADRNDPLRTLPPALAMTVQRFLAEGCQGGIERFVTISGYSTDHLNRLIRATMGTTTTGLVNDLRIAEAKRLLRERDRPVLDIALACGFSNLSHFYREFKARTGTTPSRHRSGGSAV